MSVRKPLEMIPKTGKIDVDALIEKGSKVKEDRVQEIKKWIIINLRLTEDMLKKVDDELENRIGMSRNAWILEAVIEKLKGLKEEQ